MCCCQKGDVSMPLLHTLSTSEIWLLFRAIHGAISTSFTGVTSTNPKEPQVVANFMYEIVQGIKSIQPCRVRAGGVFVHASPLVSCGNFPSTTSESVELSDLLLIRSKVINGVRSKQAGLLLQAKKADRLPCTPDNENQHHLYSLWPTFTYTSVGSHGRNQGQNPLVGKSRTIRCNDISNGTKYLLINKSSTGWGHFSCCTNHCCCIPSGACEIAATAIATPRGLSHYECFAHELLRFILGSGGKPFTLSPPAMCIGWSRVMEDLLKNVARLTSAFTTRASPVANATRGTGEYCMYTKDLDVHSCLGSYGVPYGSSNDEPPRIEDRPLDDDAPRGISILEFVVSHEEGRRE